MTYERGLPLSTKEYPPVFRMRSFESSVVGVAIISVSIGVLLGPGQ